MRMQLPSREDVAHAARLGWQALALSPDERGEDEARRNLRLGEVASIWSFTLFAQLAAPISLIAGRVLSGQPGMGPAHPSER